MHCGAWFPDQIRHIPAWRITGPGMCWGKLSEQWHIGIQLWTMNKYDGNQGCIPRSRLKLHSPVGQQSWPAERKLISVQKNGWGGAEPTPSPSCCWSTSWSAPSACDQQWAVIHQMVIASKASKFLAKGWKLCTNKAKLSKIFWVTKCIDLYFIHFMAHSLTVRHLRWHVCRL